ncbi:unnamed protein product, partial [Acidocella sp. C78]
VCVGHECSPCSVGPQPGVVLIFVRRHLNEPRGPVKRRRSRRRRNVPLRHAAPGRVWRQARESS